MVPDQRIICAGDKEITLRLLNIDRLVLNSFEIFHQLAVQGIAYSGIQTCSLTGSAILSLMHLGGTHTGPAQECAKQQNPYDEFPYHI